jgi:hypothetical protein
MFIFLRISFLICFQSSLANLVVEYLGFAGASAVRVFRTFRCLRPLRAMSRLESLKVMLTLSPRCTLLFGREATYRLKSCMVKRLIPHAVLHAAPLQRGAS